jgi:hypothetical protein
MTLLQLLAPRLPASDLRPGQRIVTPGIREPAIVAAVVRDGDFEDDCVNVVLRDNRVLILHEAVRVGVGH